MLAFMETDIPQPLHLQTHLFTVRLWVEELADGQTEVRMQARHTVSGETHYFRDGELLLSYLLTKVQELEQESATGQSNNPLS
jgi:hypothetical protein